jgi:hypothetical protein
MWDVNVYLDMERGTDWEREALVREWARMERQHRQATRLLGGIGLLLFGALCLFVGTATSACVGDNGVVPMCTSVVADPVAAALLVAGGGALALGTWRCVTVLR